MVKSILIAVLILGSQAAQASQALVSFAAERLPHLDLEMTGAEYAQVLGQSTAREHNTLAAEDLDAILAVGRRNLDWLTFINQARSESAKLSFSTPETQQAYPVEQPRIYNPALIQASYDELLGQLPEAMKSVLVGGASFTTTPPLDEAEYLAWGLKVDRAYQIAARWLLLSPSLDELARRKSRDIRGYYFFLKEADLQAQLEHWSALSAATQARYRSYLIGMCLNNNGGRSCAATVDTQLAKNGAWRLFEKFQDRSRQIYEAFFKIGQARRDVKWDEREQVMRVPFVQPAENFQDFLKGNIEDEWKWNGWRLVLDFVASANPFYTPHLVFVPGATPHVNGLAGNEITMDENAPLTEYNVKWTIRHEYGHVLGFPDCYHEFYDAEQGVIISYQIDITDLMCSRRGHLKELHFNELKRVYQHGASALRSGL